MSLQRVVSLSLLVACAACGPRELRVAMNSDNNSGQSGFAVLTDLGASHMSVYVETNIPSANSSKQKAHIHEGTCGEVGVIRAPLTELENADGGTHFTSTTDVRSLGFKDLESGEWVINVHDPLDNSVYVSCGEIPRP